MSTSNQKSRLNIPPWVALAGMILAFIIAIIIMVNILQPLVNLIFPSDPEPPIPPDAVILEEIENPATSSGEWLYGVQTPACEIARFYAEAGSICRYTPLACAEAAREAEEGVTSPQGVKSIAVCTGTKSGVVNSYSWEALISSSQGEYETSIRLFLYTER